MEALNPQGPSMKPNPAPRVPLSGALGIFSAAALVLFAAGRLAWFFRAPTQIGVGLRWTGLALIVPLAARRRSLLLWTFLAMLAGVELGVDAPRFAAQTHFLGEMFLRLIRMIVAPLIF